MHLESLVLTCIFFLFYFFEKLKDEGKSMSELMSYSKYLLKKMM